MLSGIGHGFDTGLAEEFGLIPAILWNLIEARCEMSYDKESFSAPYCNYLDLDEIEEGLKILEESGLLIKDSNRFYRNIGRK